MKEYIKYFAELDGLDKEYQVAVENFFLENVPVFRCSDKELELIYYFRWWVYYKHIKMTPRGYLITEFLPDVNWAGPYNSINYPAAHHVLEGRWLRNPRYVEDDLRFWFTGGGNSRSYTTWLQYAAWQYSLTREADALMEELLPHMMLDYACWEGSVGQEAGLRENGLFETIDDREGTEISLSGDGYRHQINAAMMGNCLGMAGLLPPGADRDKYLAKAAALKENICKMLWNPEDSFFEVLHKDGKLAGVRDLGGYTPWYFTEMPAEYEKAWSFLGDEKHFTAPYGYTFADQSHPGFIISYEGHSCQWNGPSWPMATSTTLTALAKELHRRGNREVTEEDFCKGMKTYTHSHFIELDGARRPWIDENLNPFTGDWISRTMLIQQNHETMGRGKDYNHSSFCDLVISGVIGLQVSAEGYKIEPLCHGWLDWFSLEGVIVKDKCLSIFWDKDNDEVRVTEE